MKVIDKKENIVLFKNVEEGEVFKPTMDRYAYMKTTPVMDCDDSITYNAVSLDDGDMMHYDDDEEVLLYANSELVVKR